VAPLQREDLPGMDFDREASLMDDRIASLGTFEAQPRALAAGDEKDAHMPGEAPLRRERGPARDPMAMGHDRCGFNLLCQRAASGCARNWSFMRAIVLKSLDSICRRRETR